MTVLLILFFAVATVLWLSIFGYALLLAVIASRRRQVELGVSACPDIAIVIPTLNEEDLILPKLADLQRTDYPSDRMTVVVVDGGSVDQTTKLIRQEIERGEPIHLVSLNGALGKADQINHALRTLTQDIVVFTDVDSVLEPSCIRELISVLERDPNTAVAGATVRPDTALLEERIHWWFQNYLWWLEGEALSSAGVSGVCFAVRRETVLPLPQDAVADDIHLSLAAAARGFRVRISRSAHATEIRVPQTASELMQFRRRRGWWYLSELLRPAHDIHAPMSWRLARLMRLWHFLVTPKIGVGLAVSACVLLWTPYWHWPLLTFVAFAAPACAALFASKTLAVEKPRWWKLNLAASRLLVLTLVSMLTLNCRPPARDPVGGKP